ncbi:MAG: nicotinate (nicotinamide) nucleotide adenylyltransferase [Candidatus Aureabacteria bacterium]|nr:nicotinate (nicotinamide) nucleotide adenylyltransferase [Candidatus Auribacterota bacterium]
MKIGIFGGSFDPVHNGHIEIARKAKSRFSLDEVSFVPCYIQPIKGQSVSDAKDRVAMLNIAVKGIKGFNVHVYEIEKKGVSYTVDTLRYIKSETVNGQLFFILGADSLSSIMSWKEPGSLPGLCEFIVYPRKGTDSGEIDSVLSEIPELKVNFIGGGDIDISSSVIRRQISEGKIDKMSCLNEGVKKYIKERRLYSIEKNDFEKNC